MLEGHEVTLSIIRNPSSSKRAALMKPILQKDGLLDDDFMKVNSRLWQRLYPHQWRQTKSTIQKLRFFDPYNTDMKLPIQKGGALGYPDLF